MLERTHIGSKYLTAKNTSSIKLNIDTGTITFFENVCKLQQAHEISKDAGTDESNFLDQNLALCLLSSISMYSTIMILLVLIKPLPLGLC